MSKMCVAEASLPTHLLTCAKNKCPRCDTAILDEAKHKECTPKTLQRIPKTPQTPGASTSKGRNTPPATQYQCHVCSKNFTKQGSLTNHLRSHFSPNEDHQKCGLCKWKNTGKSAADRKSAFDQHMDDHKRKIHQLEEANKKLEKKNKKRTSPDDPDPSALQKYYQEDKEERKKQALDEKIRAKETLELVSKLGLEGQANLLKMCCIQQGGKVTVTAEPAGLIENLKKKPIVQWTTADLYLLVKDELGMEALAYELQKKNAEGYDVLQCINNNKGQFDGAAFFKQLDIVPKPTADLPRFFTRLQNRINDINQE